MTPSFEPTEEIEMHPQTTDSVQRMRESSSARTDHGNSIGQSGQILTAISDFVPTGSMGDARAECEWQLAMKRAVRSADQLRQILGLQSGSLAAEPEFPTFVPWEYIGRIRHGDPNDPLLKQVLPVAIESKQVAGYTSDPVGDLKAMAVPGLLHKYDGRVLLVATGACGVHCRYCFRREFPYSDATSRGDKAQASLDYIANDPSIDEVILSGGDPLTLVDEKLGELVQSIQQIPHVRRLRVHTRMPIVIPQRVTDPLVKLFSQSRLTTWFVVHANHANELDQSVLNRLAKLIDAGIPVLNQAVLLRGVNDNASALIDLCRTLINHRIQPYYLHQLDTVQGAAHFEVSIAQGNRLMTELRSALPGYAVPTYVVEQVGQSSKTPIISG